MDEPERCVICHATIGPEDSGLCDRHKYDEQLLRKPHRDRRWPRGETPSLFEDA